MGAANATASAFARVPLGAAPGAALCRNAAVWSLRALLAVVMFAWFAVTPPQAAHLTMTLELGRRAIGLHEFGLGWLSAAIAHTVATASGPGGIAAVSGASVVVALALVEFRARSRAGYVLSLFAGIAAAFGFLDVLHIGAGATSWFCAAALLLLLDRARGFALVLGVAAVSILWSNLAPQGILAPLLTGLVALGRTVDRGVRAPETRDGWLASIGSALAILCTPAGIGFVTLASWGAHLHRVLSEVMPLGPDAIAPHAYYGMFFALVVAGAALGVARRTDERLLLAAGLFLCLRDGGVAPLLGIIAAPILVGSLVERAPHFFAEPPARARLADGLIAGLTLVIIISIATTIRPRLQQTFKGDASYSLLQRYAAGDNRPHGIFCSVIAWCDYAVVLPTLRPLMDERVERSNPSTRKAQHDVARVAKGWERTLASQHIDTVLTHRSDALAALLELSPHWSVVDARADAILFGREAQ